MENSFYELLGALGLLLTHAFFLWREVAAVRAQLGKVKESLVELDRSKISEDRIEVYLRPITQELTIIEKSSREREKKLDRLIEAVYEIRSSLPKDV